MAEDPTPRQMLKGLLQGVTPPRPLFVPIVFSLGAKLENLSRRAFLANPTKISNSLRQIRSHLRSDGVACYFDPFLEAEALGGMLEWLADDRPPTIRWPEPAVSGELPQGLRAPDEAAKCGRALVAVEAIRRLKSLLRDDPVLMAGVSGPLTLAARLVQLKPEGALRMEDLPSDALELASSASTQIAAAFGEAGANMIFIQEDFLPPLTGESSDTWAALLSPTVNVVRFYEAMPVLHLTNGRAFAQNCALILERQWNCLLCPALDGIASLAPGRVSGLGGTRLGIAAPYEAFRPEQAGAEVHPSLARIISEVQPAIVTTVGDVPATADLKHLTRFHEEIERAASGAGA